jgi:hypothetical protein
MAGSKPVGSFALLKKEVKRIFDKGLLISSYNISGRRKGAKPLSAAQPRLPSEARELLPRGGCRGGNAPAPARFSGLRGRGDAATLLKLRASSFWQGGVAALRRKKINADRMAFLPLPSTAS